LKGLIKGQPCSPIQNVYASRRESDLQYSSVIREVVRGHIELFKRGTESGKSSIDILCIRTCRSNKNIEIFRSTRMPMKRNSVATDNDEIGSGIGQFDQ
jgi:hypothetical protein